MSTISVGQKIIAPVGSSSRFNALFGSQKLEERVLLGNPVNGRVPIRFTRNVGSSNSADYSLSPESKLLEMANVQKAKILNSDDLPAADKNVIKLWSASNLWEHKDGVTTLNRDFRTWATFGENGLITNLTNERPDSNSYTELLINEDNSLGMGLRQNAPLELYGQLEIINWLLSQVTTTLK